MLVNAKLLTKQLKNLACFSRTYKDYLSDTMKKIDNVVIFAGAGLSAESGVPTFRNENGLWENYSIDEVCEQSTWLKNYETVHKFYNMLRTRLADVEPNEGHKTLVRLQKKHGVDKVRIITTNVDDLLERAGAKNVLHVHGDLRYVRTPGGKLQFLGYKEWDYTNDPYNDDPELATKPHVTFFGGFDHKYDEMYDIMTGLTYGDLMVSVGCSDQVVNPIDYLNYQVTKFRVNLDPDTDYHYDSNFVGKSSEQLLEVEKWLNARMQHNITSSPGL